MPENIPSEVQQAIDYFEWRDIADLPIALKQNQRQVEGIPDHTTLRNLLRYHLDLFGRPRRYFFELLAFFADDALQREKLLEFSTAAGQDELYSYCHKMKRTYFEVLQDFSSVKLPLQYLLDLIPMMRPRMFSISSSPLDYPDQVHLTVGIVEYRTRMKATRVGVCTKWMAKLSVGDYVRCHVSKGTFRLPADDVPVVCIGPGTGIAPMRSILQSRQAQLCSGNIFE